MVRVLDAFAEAGVGFITTAVEVGKTIMVWIELGFLPYLIND